MSPAADGAAGEDELERGEGGWSDSRVRGWADARAESGPLPVGCRVVGADVWLRSRGVAPDNRGAGGRRCAGGFGHREGWRADGRTGDGEAGAADCGEGTQRQTLVAGRSVFVRAVCRIAAAGRGCNAPGGCGFELFWDAEDRGGNA